MAEKSPSIPGCAAHPEKKVSYYCPEEKVSFCDTCVKHHATHKFQHLQEICKKYFLPWQKLKENISKLKKRIESIIESIPEEQQELFVERVAVFFEGYEKIKEYFKDMKIQSLIALESKIDKYKKKILEFTKELLQQYGGKDSMNSSVKTVSTPTPKKAQSLEKIEDKVRNKTSSKEKDKDQWTENKPERKRSKNIKSKEKSSAYSNLGQNQKEQSELREQKEKTKRKGTDVPSISIMEYSKLTAQDLEVLPHPPPLDFTQEDNLTDQKNEEIKQLKEKCERLENTVELLVGKFKKSQKKNKRKFQKMQMQLQKKRVNKEKYKLFISQMKTVNQLAQDMIRSDATSEVSECQFTTQRHEDSTFTQSQLDHSMVPK